VAVGDVKCDNVLLAGRGSVVRLADFGWSCANAVGGRCGGRLCGTPEYIAPEVCFCKFCDGPPPGGLRSYAVSRTGLQ
jgi:serine/threonine protein kinase